MNSFNPIKKGLKFLVVFAVILSIALPYTYPAKIECIWTDVERIIAVGDIHGAYDKFVIILKENKIIDEDLHWQAGKAHLVQTGDIMDRGPNAKEAFDLLMRLEKEAEEAGGKVHVLLGNHEELNITGTAFGYAGYVTAEQFVSFLPDDYREKKEKEFIKKRKDKSANLVNLDITSNEDLRKYWQDKIKKDWTAQMKYTQCFNSVYGKWLLTKNAVIKINDIIFVHGGISEKYSKWNLEDINDRIRRELKILCDIAKTPKGFGTRRYNPEIVYRRDGPLWYRGLAQNEEEIFHEEVDKILNNLGVHYMVIAHTPQFGSPTFGEGSEYGRRFNDRIWVIDTGISDYYGGFLSALIIENGKFTLWGKPDEE